MDWPPCVHLFVCPFINHLDSADVFLMNDASDHSSLKIDTDDQEFEKGCCSMKWQFQNYPGQGVALQSEININCLLLPCQWWILCWSGLSVTWWALAAKPRPSCLHTTMASLMPQFSLQTEPQRLRPLTSISTSTRPSDGTLPPASRTWKSIRLKGLNWWCAISESW